MRFYFPNGKASGCFVRTFAVINFILTIVGVWIMPIVAIIANLSNIQSGSIDYIWACVSFFCDLFLMIVCIPSTIYMFKIAVNKTQCKDQLFEPIEPREIFWTDP